MAKMKPETEARAADQTAVARRFDQYLAKLRERFGPEVVESAILSKAGGIAASRSRGGRSEVVTRCPWCGERFNATEMALHRGRCVKRPARHPGGRPPVLSPCPDCGVVLSTGELRVHRPRCPVKTRRK